MNEHRPLSRISCIKPVPWTEVSADNLYSKDGALNWDVDADVVYAFPRKGARAGQTIIIPLDNIAHMVLMSEEELARLTAPPAELAQPAQAELPLTPAVDDTIRLTPNGAPGRRPAPKKVAIKDPVLDGLLNDLADDAEEE